MKVANGGDFPGLLIEWRILFPESPDIGNFEETPDQRALRWLLGMWLMKDAGGFLEAASPPDFNYSYQAAGMLARLMPGKAVELVFGRASESFDEFFIKALASNLAEYHPALYLKMNPGGTFLIGANHSHDDWLTAVDNLSKIDPLGAANASLEWKVGDASEYRDKAMKTALATWNGNDQLLMDWVYGIKDPVVRKAGQNIWLSLLAGKDVEAALIVLLGSKPEFSDGTDTPRILLEELALQSPSKALHLMKQLEEAFGKGGANSLGDPSLMDADRRWKPFEALYSTGFHIGGQQGENGVRSSILSMIAAGLPDDPALLLAASRRLFDADGSFDPAWQHEVSAGLIQWKCREWSPENCLAATKLWVEAGGMPDEGVLQSLASRLVRVDADLALEKFDDIPDAARPAFAAEIFAALPGMDAGKASKLLAYLSGKQMNWYLGNALAVKAEDHADFVADLPAEGARNTAGYFASEWGRRDPEAAARWVAELPTGAALRFAAEGLAEGWATYDEYAASEWAATLPAGKGYDGAAFGLACRLAESGPGEAWRWASSISDPGDRAEALSRVWSHWRKEAPGDFREELIRARQAVGLKPEMPVLPETMEDPFADLSE